MAEHGVGFAQLLHAARHGFRGDAYFVGKLGLVFRSWGTNSCSGGSISRIVTGKLPWPGKFR